MDSYRDTPLQCKRHPAQTVEGICAVCLRERLNKLMCVHCSASPVACSSCSYCPSGSVMKPLEGAISLGSVGTIASLIEIDTMTGRRLLEKQLKGGLYVSDWENRSLPPIRRSMSVSAAGGSKNDYYRDWELRPFRRSARTRTLQSASCQISEGDKENTGTRGSSTASPLKSGTKTTQLKEESARIAHATPLTGPPGKLRETASRRARQTALHETESSITAHRASLRGEDPVRQASESGHDMAFTHPDARKGELPHCARGDCQLIRSESTGSASSSDGSKATPEIWMKLTSAKAAPSYGKAKKLNIFARMGSAKRCSSAMASRQDSASAMASRQDSASAMASRQDSGLSEILSPAAGSRWAFLGCVYGVKEERASEDLGSPTAATTRGHLDDRVDASGSGELPLMNGRPREQSISSLISMELPSEHTFPGSRSRSGWNRTLFRPTWAPLE